MAEKNKDMNQSKNRAEQAEEHDESVLNPEIKNESDLSRKERRLIEKEKLKGMLASWTAGFEKKATDRKGAFYTLVNLAQFLVSC